MSKSSITNCYYCYYCYFVPQNLLNLKHSFLPGCSPLSTRRLVPCSMTTGRPRFEMSCRCSVPKRFKLVSHCASYFFFSPQPLSPQFDPTLGLSVAPRIIYAGEACHSTHTPMQMKTPALRTFSRGVVELLFLEVTAQEEGLTISLGTNKWPSDRTLCQIETMGSH